MQLWQKRRIIGSLTALLGSPDLTHAPIIQALVKTLTNIGAFEAKQFMQELTRLLPDQISDEDLRTAVTRFRDKGAEAKPYQSLVVSKPAILLLVPVVASFYVSQLPVEFEPASSALEKITRAVLKCWTRDEVSINFAVSLVPFMILLLRNHIQDETSTGIGRRTREYLQNYLTRLRSFDEVDATLFSLKATIQHLLSSATLSAIPRELASTELALYLAIYGMIFGPVTDDRLSPIDAATIEYIKRWTVEPEFSSEEEDEDTVRVREQVRLTRGQKTALPAPAASVRASRAELPAASVRLESPASARVDTSPKVSQRLTPAALPTPPPGSSIRLVGSSTRQPNSTREPTASVRALSDPRPTS